MTYLCNSTLVLAYIPPTIYLSLTARHILTLVQQLEVHRNRR